MANSRTKQTKPITAKSNSVRPILAHDFMAPVAKDIITMKVDASMTLLQMEQMFYKIMRKHKIKRGTKSSDGKGVIMDNYEWTMCKMLFLSRIQSVVELGIEWDVHGFKGTPKDLKSY